MHLAEVEEHMHVHYMHDQNHGMHHMSNGDELDDEHDDGGGVVGGVGLDNELQNDHVNIGDNNGGMLIPGGDNDQPTLSFQGQVYVFDSVSPEKVQAVLLLLGGRELPTNVPAVPLTSSHTNRMDQTPLRVSAGYNKAKIVKVPLEWKGQAKVEAKNTGIF